MRHIAILDFGSQYTHLIARRIRELKVLAKIYPPDIKAARLPAEVIGIILSGGPQSVYDQGSLSIDKDILNLDKPILGLCYGHQLLAHLLGGEVQPGTVREYGRAQLRILRRSPLFAGVTPGFQTRTVWMSHGDTVIKLPDGFATIGATSDCPNAAIANVKKKIYGLQFHPEVHHTAAGKQILSNFVFKICQAEPNWEIVNQLDEILGKIRAQAQNKKVFLLVSGGVDSTVCFALLERALGKDRVFGLHVDTGFMRLNESAAVKKDLAQAGYDNLHTVDAGRTFYQRLKGITDPEEKRKIIGQTFLDVQERSAVTLGFKTQPWLLGQGTIYPDTIESGGTKHADKIKTHHNRVDAVQRLIEEGKVIEPIADFYKDEVRELGRLLGLPEELINRHPFPGPGLAIRVLCNPLKSPPLRGGVRPARLATRSVSGGGGVSPQTPTPASPAGGLPSPWKGQDIGCSLLPIKSVGVQGDNRTYAHPLALWNIAQGDPAQLDSTGRAIWGEQDWEKLDQLSSQITNANRHINRVLLLLNPPASAPPSLKLRRASAGKPVDQELPGQLYESYLTPERVELLRKIDAVVNEVMLGFKTQPALWQFPVVLVPFGQNGKESIVLRPVVSQEAMTAHFARLPQVVLDEIVKAILDTGQVSFVFYDITNKPPGTIEWE